MLIADIEKYVIERTEAFKKELNEEVKQMIKEANQGQIKSIWDLKKEDGEDYYRLYSDGDIERVVFYNDYDKQARDIGNAFLTREEAEFELKRREIEAIIRRYSRPFKIGVYNHVIKYNQSTDTVFASADWSTNTGTVYFESEEIAKKVINMLGKSRLKKYWFGVTE